MFLPAELKRWTKELQFDMRCKAICRDFDRECEFLQGTYNGAAFNMDRYFIVLKGSLRPPLNLVPRSWKQPSWCRYGDSDAETEFLELLLEPACVFWRKVPMCTLQFYFGKSATGYCSLWASQKAPSPHPQEGLFYLFWTNAAKFQISQNKIR